MAAIYVPREHLRALARQYWRYGQYREKTSVRHPESMRPSHLLAPAVMLTGIGAALPGPHRGLARAGLSCWLAALVGTTVTHFGREPVRDVAWLPAVLATMHLSWGAGFLLGCVRFGPPMAALSNVLRRRA